VRNGREVDWSLFKGTANALSIVTDFDGLDVQVVVDASKNTSERGAAEAGGLELRAGYWLAPLQKQGDVWDIP